MSFKSSNPCPCESGLDYLQCCDNPLIDTLNFHGKVLAEYATQSELTPEVKSALDNFCDEPSLFPVFISFSNNHAQLVKMSPYWFSESTFLDLDRIRGRYALNCTVDWLESQCSTLKRQASPMIFHSAFCGSTLMSRALELIYNCLPMREPVSIGSLLHYRISKDFDLEKEKKYSRLIRNIYARRFEESQIPVIKANDYVNSYLPYLVKYEPDTPILLMYSSLNDFIAGCVKSDERKQWIKDRFELLMTFFLKEDEKLKYQHIDTTGHVELAAAYWSYNLKIFSDITRQSPLTIKTLEFDAMLQNTEAMVEKVAYFFNLEKIQGINPANELRWLMSVHAKEPLYEYTAEKRREELDEALKQVKNELDRAEKIARDLLKDDFPNPTLANNL